MFNLEQRYHEYIHNYVKDHGQPPDEAVMECCKAIINTGNRIYIMGVSDAQNNMLLPDSVFDDFFGKDPDVPASFREAITDLMKMAYRSGWKEGSIISENLNLISAQ